MKKIQPSSPRKGACGPEKTKIKVRNKLFIYLLAYLILEEGSHYIAQADPEFMILLPLHQEC